MKAKSIFALAFALLATFSALAQDTGVSTYPVPDDPAPVEDSFQKDCLNFCARVLCAQPQVCGVYTKNGSRACGCHDPLSSNHNQNFNQIDEP